MDFKDSTDTPYVKKSFDTIQVVYEAGRSAFTNNTNTLHNYKTLQFHIHAPSEHTFKGEHYDLELHFVHRDTSDPSKLAVVAVFFDTKKGGNLKNSFIESMKIASLDDHLALDGNVVKVGTLISSLNKNGNVYNYPGSLTTPPCTENVNWIVIDDPQTISESQLAEINAFWSSNKTFANGNGNNR